MRTFCKSFLPILILAACNGGGGHTGTGDRTNSRDANNDAVVRNSNEKVTGIHTTYSNTYARRNYVVNKLGANYSSLDMVANAFANMQNVLMVENADLVFDVDAADLRNALRMAGASDDIASDVFNDDDLLRVYVHDNWAALCARASQVAYNYREINLQLNQVGFTTNRVTGEDVDFAMLLDIGSESKTPLLIRGIRYDGTEFARQANTNNFGTDFYNFLVANEKVLKIGGEYGIPDWAKNGADLKDIKADLLARIDDAEITDAKKAALQNQVNALADSDAKYVNVDLRGGVVGLSFSDFGMIHVRDFFAPNDVAPAATVVGGYDDVKITNFAAVPNDVMTFTGAAIGQAVTDTKTLDLDGTATVTLATKDGSTTMFAVFENWYDVNVAENGTISFSNAASGMADDFKWQATTGDSAQISASYYGTGDTPAEVVGTTKYTSKNAAGADLHFQAAFGARAD